MNSDPLSFSSLRTDQEQSEGNVPRRHRAPEPPPAVTKWDGPSEGGRQRQPHGPSQAHVRGSPQLPRDPGHAAPRHRQEEGGLPGAPEAEVSPPRVGHHGSPGEAARAGR